LIVTSSKENEFVVLEIMETTCSKRYVSPSVGCHDSIVSTIVSTGFLQVLFDRRTRSNVLPIAWYMSAQPASTEYYFWPTGRSTRTWIYLSFLDLTGRVQLAIVPVFTMRNV
jgi:hypothetical protein